MSVKEFLIRYHYMVEKWERHNDSRVLFLKNNMRVSFPIGMWTTDDNKRLLEITKAK